MDITYVRFLGILSRQGTIHISKHKSILSFKLISYSVSHYNVEDELPLSPLTVHSNIRNQLLEVPEFGLKYDLKVGKEKRGLEKKESPGNQALNNQKSVSISIMTWSEWIARILTESNL